MGLLALGGCGGSDRPLIVPVGGKIVYKGEPVEGAKVTFHPTGESPRKPIGTTNANGEFRLTTFDTNDGAPPGEYVVTVYKPQQRKEEAAMDPEEPDAAYDQAMRAVRELDAGKQMVETTLPAKYADQETSTIERTVAADGPNEFTIELEE